MLTAKDSWGRTLISHGILSGSPQVFEEAFVGVRNDVLDEVVRSASGTHTLRCLCLCVSKHCDETTCSSVDLLLCDADVTMFEYWSLCTLCDEIERVLDYDFVYSA